MQDRSNDEVCNLLVQSIISRDEKLLQNVLDIEDEAAIKDVVNRLPANYVRKLLIELGNLLSSDMSTKHLRWVQSLLAHKYSVVSTMSDGRSIIMPLISLLEDRSSPEYYKKVQSLKGKITLLQQLRESRRSEGPEVEVRVPADPEQPQHMDVDSETDTESEDELDEHAEANSHCDENDDDHNDKEEVDEEDDEIDEEVE